MYTLLVVDGICTVQDTVGGTASAQIHTLYLDINKILTWNCTGKIHPSERWQMKKFHFSFCVRIQKKQLMVIRILKLQKFPSHGTCQMLCEQLAYQTITVMVDCPLWFQHVCGLTNFAHTLENQVNNGLFFLVQLSDFGKEGRKKKCLCQGMKPWFIIGASAHFWYPWAVAWAELGFGIQSELRSNQPAVFRRR